MKKFNRNIVLISPSISSLDGIKGPGFRTLVENVGMGYVAAALKNNEYNTIIITQNHYSNKQIARIIYENAAWLVCFSLFSAAMPNAIDITRRIKSLKPKTITIAGGIHPSIDPENTAKYFDFCIVGEGEQTIIKLIESLNTASSLENIQGLAYYNANHDYVYTGQAQRITNLSSLKWPQRDWAIIRQGLGQQPRPYGRHGYATVIASRGCYGNCSFCTNKAIWDCKITTRDPTDIVDELSYITSRGIDYYYFGDENFTQNRNRVFELCEEIINRGLDIRWVVMGRVNDIDDSMLALMKKAGCCQIGYGIESGDPKIVKKINKRIDLNKASEVIKQTNAHGIFSAAYFILNSPLESRESLELSRYFILNELDALRLRLAFVYPFKKTRLRKEVESSALWVKTKYRDDRYATTEIPVLRGDLSENEYINYQKQTLLDYYSSKRYLKTLSFFKYFDRKNDTMLSEWHNMVTKCLN